jgi:hypothetical protein
MHRSLDGFGPAALAGGALLMLACGSDGLLLPSDSQPAALAVVDGNHQNAQVGAPLPEPVVVKVTDGTGRPVVGARIVFRVTSTSGGELSPAEATTDNTGQAATQWSLGPTAGPQTAEASVDAPAVEPVALMAFAAAGVPARLELAAGDAQTAPVGTLLPESLMVRATDAAGNPVEGVGVSWSAPEGGSVSAPAVATGSDGRAGVRVTLGPAAGEQRAVATVNGVRGSPVTFSATATTGAAGKLTIVAQPSGSATNGQPLAEQPRVQLVDAFNNPVATEGVAITVSVDGNPSGVELDGQRTVATDQSGVAAFTGIALTGPPGNYALRFSGASLADVVSRAIQLGPAGVSASRSSVGAASERIVVTVESTTMTVTVRDAFGFPVPGITVTPAASPATASFTPASAPTNASGVATFSVTGNAPGDYELSASAGSVELTERAAVQVVKAGTSTSIVSDQPDPSALFQEVPVAFSVTSAVGQPLTGTVTIREVEGSSTCTVPATAGICGDFRFSGLGTRTLVATYDGDAIHDASSSEPETHQVQLFAP